MSEANYRLLCRGSCLHELRPIPPDGSINQTFLSTQFFIHRKIKPSVFVLLRSIATCNKPMLRNKTFLLFARGHAAGAFFSKEFVSVPGHPSIRRISNAAGYDAQHPHHFPRPAQVCGDVECCSRLCQFFCVFCLHHQGGGILNVLQIQALLGGLALQRAELEVTFVIML